MLSQDKESEIALADAVSRLSAECRPCFLANSFFPHLQLSRPHPRRFDQFDSDDNASETSSVCSETSYRSAGPFRGSDVSFPLEIPVPFAADIKDLEAEKERKIPFLLFKPHTLVSQRLLTLLS